MGHPLLTERRPDLVSVPLFDRTGFHLSAWPCGGQDSVSAIQRALTHP
jgi:hypothetical protein